MSLNYYPSEFIVQIFNDLSSSCTNCQVSVVAFCDGDNLRAEQRVIFKLNLHRFHVLVPDLNHSVPASRNKALVFACPKTCHWPCMALVRSVQSPVLPNYQLSFVHACYYVAFDKPDAQTGLWTTVLLPQSLNFLYYSSFESNEINLLESCCYYGFIS